MKVLFVLVFFCTTFSIFAQSKKDQIAALTLRLDSLSREYVKDTAQLNQSLQKLERKNSVLSGQYKAAQEQNKKKSQAIRDKTETIKTLNASNLELMQVRKEMQKEINSLNDSIRMLKKMNASGPCLGQGSPIPEKIMKTEFYKKYYKVKNNSENVYSVLVDSRMYRELGQNKMILIIKDYLPYDDNKESWGQELNYYVFSINNQTFLPEKKWSESILECPVDIGIEHLDIQFSDINRDGYVELWLINESYCKGDVSPNQMNIYTYENSNLFHSESISIRGMADMWTKEVLDDFKKEAVDELSIDPQLDQIESFRKFIVKVVSKNNGF